MTLIVAIRLGNGDVWMAGDRRVGDFTPQTIASPKVFDLEADSITGQRFAIGFSGEPVVAQSILAVTPPDRDGRNRSLHWWLTEYVGRIREQAVTDSLLCDPHDGEPPHLAGHTGALIAIEGRVVLLSSRLGWEDVERCWRSTGGAYEAFDAAYLALSKGRPSLAAARRAWGVAAEIHRIGPIADEVRIGAQPST